METFQIPNCFTPKVKTMTRRWRLLAIVAGCVLLVKWLAWLEERDIELDKEYYNPGWWI